MRKLVIALLVVVMALGAWLIFRTPPGVFDAQSPAGLASADIEDGPAAVAIAPAAALLTAPAEESRDWEYLHLFGSLADEPIDPVWARPTEATIDNTLRSLGRYFSDLEVHCRTSECGAVIFYQPAFFGLDEQTRETELEELLTKLELLDSVLQVSTRLDAYVGAGLALLSQELPDGTDPASSLGTTIHFRSRQDE